VDGTHFDALARRLNDRLSRRRVVASMLGLAGAAIVVDPIGAHTCRPAGRKCASGAQCCSGRCDTARTTRRSQRNRCVCQPNERVCRGLCFDFAVDERNCGGCGVQCLPNQSCIDGECICDDPNAIVCGGVCTDITTPDHCGPTCEPCPPGHSCVDGACTCGGATCTDTQACCGGACLEVDQDDNNCGACGNVCGAGKICFANECRQKCTPNLGQPPYVHCANLINGETANVNAYNIGDNPECDSQDDCAAGHLCIYYLELQNGTPWDLRPGECMFNTAEP